MAATEGNNFWEARSRHGRLPSFSSPEQMWEVACEYFQWCVDNPLKKPVIYQGVKCGDEDLMRPFTKGGFCIFAGCTNQTLTVYRDKQDFSDVVAQIDEIIYNQKFSGAAVGLLNSNIIARDLGLADKKEVEASVNSTIWDKIEVVGE